MKESNEKDLASYLGLDPYADHGNVVGVASTLLPIAPKTGKIGPLFTMSALKTGPPNSTGGYSVALADRLPSNKMS
jgi:hypothetical protein